MRDRFILILNGCQVEETYSSEVDATRAAVALVKRQPGVYATVPIVNDSTGLVIGVAVDDADGARVIVPQR